MLLIPAIDIKDGQCVRLRQGDMSQDTVYGDDPVMQRRSSNQSNERRYRSKGQQRKRCRDCDLEKVGVGIHLITSSNFRSNPRLISSRTSSRLDSPMFTRCT